MSTITIKKFAEQIGIESERLVKQLNDAGVEGKTVDGSLKDAEKRQLLDFLRGSTTVDEVKPELTSRGKITLKKKTTSEIQQTTKTGVARTVQVQTKKRRTFVKREVLEQQEQERQEAEQVRVQEENDAQEAERLAEEQAALEAQQKAEEAAAAEAERIAQEKAAEEARLQAEAEESKRLEQEGTTQKETVVEAAQPLEKTEQKPAEVVESRKTNSSD